MTNSLNARKSNIDNDTKDIRVILVRLYSDGFEAHNVKERTNLHLFTLTVVVEPGMNCRNHTAPLVLCHKKKNHLELFMKILGEIIDHQSPKWRFWDMEKKQSK